MAERSARRVATVGVCAAAAVIGLGACGGSSPSHVASLGTSTSSSGGAATTTGGQRGTTTIATGANATTLLDEWATCMRRHGDRNQADPTVDTNGVIHITWDPSVPGGYNGTHKGGQGNLGPGQYCRTYLSEAQDALRGGRPEQLPSTAQLVKFAGCMRAHGIHDFPDPTGSGLQMSMGGDLNPSNPAFHRAGVLCEKKTGVKAPGVGPPPPGTIELNGGAPGG